MLGDCWIGNFLISYSPHILIGKTINIFLVSFGIKILFILFSSHNITYLFFFAHFLSYFNDLSSRTIVPLMQYEDEVKKTT